MYKSMTPKERHDFYFQNEHWLPEGVPMCINCKHFHRHYVHKGPPVYTVQWTPLNCGHCAYPRLKDRKAYDTCEHFEQKGKE